MRTLFHPASSRGHADHGWLNAHHTFSFAGYYDPERVHFGMLRVLNDDIIEGGMGFDTHPHDNMEIVTIPITGALRHKDSMGNGSVIKANEIQIMSAGKGIQHSEFNASEDEVVNLLQIWIFPKVRNVVPRYGQLELKTEDLKNQLKTVISPAEEGNGLWLHQDAWFSIGDLDAGLDYTYDLHAANHGIYLFVISGAALVEGQEMTARDGIGLWETNRVSFQTTETSRILIMEVPMN